MIPPMKHWEAIADKSVLLVERGAIAVLSREMVGGSVGTLKSNLSAHGSRTQFSDFVKLRDFRSNLQQSAR
jgi:O-acetylhomoserine/O-acetylserine sulfhydrylase-like pyridoxal-dependent enzyme